MFLFFYPTKKAAVQNEKLKNFRMTRGKSQSGLINNKYSSMLFLHDIPKIHIKFETLFFVDESSQSPYGLKTRLQFFSLGSGSKKEYDKGVYSQIPYVIQCIFRIPIPRALERDG